MFSAQRGHNAQTEMLAKRFQVAVTTGNGIVLNERRTQTLEPLAVQRSLIRRKIGSDAELYFANSVVDCRSAVSFAMCKFNVK
jgi:hypothetical protein